MAVRWARGVQARPERVPRRGFVANGAAFLWRTLCAATGARVLAQVRGFASGEHCSPWPFVRRGAYRPGRDVPPPRFRGERVRILWRTLCAATGGTGLAQVRGLAANGSAILWRTLCAATGDCGFRRWGPRYHGEQVCILWRTLCAATGGTGFGAGRTKCRDRSGEHCSPWPFDGRGAHRSGRNVCPAAALWRTGPHFVTNRSAFCGARCAPLQGARGLA